MIEFFDLAYPQLAGLLFAVPNAARRSHALAAYLRKEGLRAGVADLMLPVARHGFHGLFIELKSLSGRATQKQLDFGARVTAQGYLFVVCRGADAAIDTLTRYLRP